MDRSKIKNRNLDDGIKKALKKGKIEKIRSVAKKKKYLKLQLKRIKNFTDIAELPEKNEVYRLITQGSFNTFTIILYILKKFEHVEELYISTYNIKETVISSLFEMLEEEKIKKLRLIVSQSITHRMPKREIQLRKSTLKSEKDVRLCLYFNHSKIALIRTENNFYVLEGSGNLSDNAWVEQYTLSNCTDAYQFYKSFMDESFLDETKKGIFRYKSKYNG